MQQRPQIPPDYDKDFFAWTQHQAKLLRTLDRRGPDLPAGLNLRQVAEEIKDLGSAELNSVKSLIRQILVHLIKWASEPASTALGHWRTEATTFHFDMLDAYTPSMRRQIDMEQLWARALKLADLRLREHGSSVSAEVPEECPFSVQDLIAEDFSFDAALERLRRQEQAPQR